MNAKKIRKNSVVVGLAGDSGDGVQLIGLQLTYSAAHDGKSVSALPSYPAEIRAPAGSVAGISSYQLNISKGDDLQTYNDKIDILFALNPAALVVNLSKLTDDALVIINSDAFNEINIKKANLPADYMASKEFNQYPIYQVPVNTLLKEATKTLELSNSELIKHKNMFVLGVVGWLTSTEQDSIIAQIQDKFSKLNTMASINETVFKAGYNYAETTEMFHSRYIIESSTIKSANNLGSGNKAFADACLAIYLKTQGKLFISGYPITPASSVLENIAKYEKEYGIRIFQAEDEISSISSAIGAAYGGSLSLTVTSGPGFDLKTEALGLAVITELPLVILNIQRSGPSTGMPTKTEQSDLFAAVYGRHGESPIPVLAPSSPSDCYAILIEAFSIALKFMTPVIILSDAYLSNAVENIMVNRMDEIMNIELDYAKNSETYFPYNRLNEDLKRPWAIPGMAGFEHCIGGLEKKEITGEVCYEAANHHNMVMLRKQKIENVAVDISQEYFCGDPSGTLLLVSWGGTYGAVKATINELAKNGINVSMLHIKHIFPLPKNISLVLRKFKKIVVVEQNTGQFASLIRDETLIDVDGYNVIDGMPISPEKLSLFLVNYLNIGENNAEFTATIN